MVNIEIDEEITFSYLNISSLSRFTMVRVNEFTEVSSLMNQCFDMTQSKFLM